MKKLIKVKNLTKIYKDGDEKIVALDNVSFDLGPGEDLAIIGPSGSGKTTLLELMAGLNSATSGSVLIDNRRVDKGSDKEVSEFRNKKMGFIFQMMHLQDYLTAEENVMLPMLVAGIDIESARTKSQDLLKQVGLEHRLTHLPGKMSGGEMQRVAFARSLANTPKIVMADEPTGKLDKKNSEKLIDLLRGIAKEKGISVIVITHDPSVAKKFGRVITIDGGKITSDIKNGK